MKTVADLRKMLANFPDDMPIGLYLSGAEACEVFGKIYIKEDDGITECRGDSPWVCGTVSHGQPLLILASLTGEESRGNFRFTKENTVY